MGDNDLQSRDGALKVLSAASFLIFFSSYLVAPLVPSLAKELNASENLVGLMVPAYLLPYGISTLFYGPLSDRIGRKRVILTLLALTIFSTIFTALARTAEQLIFLRVISGLCTGGIVPIALALVGDLFPYEKRGNAMGWLFGAIAGGVAFGSTFGAALNPIIGWRWEFAVLALANTGVFYFAFRLRHLFETAAIGGPHGLAATFTGYAHLLKSHRARRTYLFIFLNGMFHSGVFAWLGSYFILRYQLGDFGIGLALLGYGLPGMFFGPKLGRLADRRGRNRLIPAGLLLSAFCALALILDLPLAGAAMVVTILSFGFDMTHPLLVGIVSTLTSERRGLAMGFNAFVLFIGFGLGALIFQICLRYGLGWALGIFASVELLLGATALAVFAGEKAVRVQQPQ